VEHTKEGIFLGQQKYTKYILERYGMLLDPNVKFKVDDDKNLEDVTMYQKMVGSLIYLTLTRPDIAYSVGVVSQYMSNPKKSHLDAV
jgi:hypothetical protein